MRRTFAPEGLYTIFKDILYLFWHFPILFRRTGPCLASTVRERIQQHDQFHELYSLLDIRDVRFRQWGFVSPWPFPRTKNICCRKISWICENSCENLIEEVIACPAYYKTPVVSNNYWEPLSIFMKYTTTVTQNNVSILIQRFDD